MRDYCLSHIPDITERFPERFGGVDLTPGRNDAYVDYDDAHEKDTKKTDCTKALNLFAEGQEYTVYGIFGGITTYLVSKIDRAKMKIFLEERWQDVDGEGSRPGQWHDLFCDENGNERALDWESKEYGTFWIYACA